MPKKKKNKFLRIIKWTLLSIVGLFLALFIYLYIVGIVHPPDINDEAPIAWQRTEHGNGFYTLHNDWFRKSNSGLYELYVEGPAFERGVVNGKLTKELIIKQEDAFAAQINKLVPSNFYRHFLKYFIGWFNRHLPENITEEYKEEIYGVSLSASDQYDYIGNNYQRILNYHAAHDIGHALQSMALVGCTSFGTWGSASQDSTLIIGRNFDFYVGDMFAEDKIVAFFRPEKGIPYMTVTWGGFTGAVSGMNNEGLTVTINAAKTTMPSASATPVSLVAKEILQYASTIKEAIAIASKRKMFVSESFLVGSAKDNKAVLIEKTPEQLAIYDPHQNRILCTNHFQSDSLSHSEKNMESLRESASPYRYERLKELIDSSGPNTVEKTVKILRDQKGLHGANIGMGNEKAVNQLIAHHSIVFEPQKGLIWVSTNPWQLGKYYAYDLHKIFSMHGKNNNSEIYDTSLTIPADTFLLTKQYKDFVRFRQLKQAMIEGKKVNVGEFVATNPEYYHTYVVAGDYLFEKNAYDKAVFLYNTALTKEVATVNEREYIKKQIELCRKKMKP